MRTNYLLAGLTLTTLVSAGSAFAADPRLMNLVMPDATTVAGVNVTNAEGTPFGQYVLAHMTSAINQQLQAFVTATGFDPRRDVSEIVAASSGPSAPSTTTSSSPSSPSSSSGVAITPNGILLALGNFDVAQMTSALAAKAPNLTVQNYGGATLIGGSGDGAKPGGSIAFLGTTIAIAGETATVKAAIDRSGGTNAINPALATQVEALSTTEDAWAVTNTPVSSFVAELTGKQPGDAVGMGTASSLSQLTQIFNSIQASSGGVKFGSNVQITGQAITSDAGNAKSIADVMTALISIASMSGSQNPQAASLVQLLQSLKVTADGTAVNVAMTIPEAQLESILDTIRTQQAKPAIRRKPVVAPAGFSLN